MSDKLLNPKETQLVQLLVNGLTVADVARELGIDYKTAARWMKRPHVEKAYKEITGNVSKMVRAQIEALSDLAIASLRASLTSPSELAKIQAIKIVLDRLDPEMRVTASQNTEQADSESGPIPVELLPYLSKDELDTIERILQQAEQRRLEAENITVLKRKEA